MTQVTVFCAVWHKDPARHALLAEHRENLRRQSVPVHPLYVFDNGDTPPAGLDAEFLCASTPLTIYHAWNMALTAVQTPLVMNLNLDDRLAPDAVEKLVRELERTYAALIGGDWRICHSQAQTDDVRPCFPMTQLPVATAWPPPVDTDSRLGTGGPSTIYGPATLWRMSVHEQIPRYPWRFTDGTPIQSMGDGFFWKALQTRGLRMVRLPQIIGNYHSHPGDQAGFRFDQDAEVESARTKGVMRT